MKVIWICGILPTGPFDPNLQSAAASVRYRQLLPCRYLATRGVESFFLHSEDFARESNLLLDDVEAVVFSKLMSPDVKLFKEHADFNLQIARNAKGQGKTILVDICDNHFGHPEYGPYHLEIVRLGDQIIASTERMAEIIYDRTGRSAMVIEDPVEGAQQPARFNPNLSTYRGWWHHLWHRPKKIDAMPGRLRLLWFGHNSNLDTISNFLPNLVQLASDIPLALEIMTGAGYGAEMLCANVHKKYGAHLSCEFREWSLENLKSSLSHCDLVVLPSDTESDRKQVKSANRLVESLWAGRHVVASPIPAYQPFQEWAWVSEDLCTGIRSALRHPDIVLDQIKHAQQYIAENFSLDVIGNKWFTALHNPEKTGKPIEQAATLRLNLGCGDKILAGYINVDVAESRGGKRPDVLCDLRRLHSFADDSADEILSVHVIEHFWRWEVKAILAEWIRILKPGGKMVIECPNLLSACEELLRQPSVASGEGPEGQRSMWVFYGDPKWQDPLMVHRWGYSPESLTKLLVEMGLTQVQQEPAQFKLREPRDMRVVGYKPS